MIVNVQIITEYVKFIFLFLRDAVAPVEATLRPKGMGLGADRKQNQELNATKQDKGSKKDEEDTQLIMEKGAYCLVENGPHRDLYAAVCRFSIFISVPCTYCAQCKF